MIQTSDEASGPGSFPLSWSALLAGTLVALALGGLMHLLGPPRGVWALVTSGVALFAGAFLASHWAGYIEHGRGASYGLVLWALTALSHAVIGHVAATGPDRPSTSVVARAGIDPYSMASDVNPRLRAQGRPEVHGDQLRVALQTPVSLAAQTGYLDWDAVANALAAGTPLNRAEAEILASRVEAEWSEARSPHGWPFAAQRAAAGSMPARWSAWIPFLSMALGLLAAMTGGALGVRHRPQRTLWSVAAAEVRRETSRHQAFP